MASYNRIILMGNLTRDVETRVTPNGTTVGKVGIACNERVKKGQDWVDEPMFVDCVMFGKTAENAAEYLSKGSPVFFEGRLKLEQWEKDGVKHSKHTVMVDRMQFIGSKGEGQGDQRSGGKSYNVPKNTQQDDDLGDIPF